MFSKVSFSFSGYLRAVSAALLLLALSSCSGGNKGMLESISISPATGTGANVSYTATGTFTASPRTVTPLPVSWFILGPGIDPPPFSYELADGSFSAQHCSAIQSKTAIDYEVVAVAPADPAASNSGQIPYQVFLDLVEARTKTSEGGFVAASAELVCP
jgi:hypothetical protein